MSRLNLSHTILTPHITPSLLNTATVFSEIQQAALEIAVTAGKRGDRETRSKALRIASRAHIAMKEITGAVKTFDQAWEEYAREMTTYELLPAVTLEELA